MRIKKLQLKDFKRFNDLTINLNESLLKIVALVGPNGCGKSSVLDAFEEFSSNLKGRSAKKATYYKKSLFQGATDETYDQHRHVLLEADTTKFDKKSFYLRSAYRFTPRLNTESIRRLPELDSDQQRPHYMIDSDIRLQESYERLLGSFYDEVYDKNVTGRAWAQAKIDGVNEILSRILDIRISFLGNPVTNEGSLYFEKGSSRKFPYENLSAGEKEVINLILDLYIKKDTYSNSVICIDEPELHLSTAIQRKLLIEIEKLIPDNSQLWVATHSIGFLRALQEELKPKSVVIDFTNIDFDQVVTVKPILGTREDWTRIFQTALEDLTGLLAPSVIVYCEGIPQPAADGTERGLDADVYNQVFSVSHSDVLFISSGGGGEVVKNSLLALKILGKAFQDVELLLLKDRDELSDDERQAFLAEDESNRMLTRREVENYLFDKEVLMAYCDGKESALDEAEYDRLVSDIARQNLKPVQQQLQHLCGHHRAIGEFKRLLAKYIKPGTAVHRALAESVFI